MLKQLTLGLGRAVHDSAKLKSPGVCSDVSQSVSQTCTSFEYLPSALGALVALPLEPSMGVALMLAMYAGDILADDSLRS